MFKGSLQTTDTICLKQSTWIRLLSKPLRVILCWLWQKVNPAEWKADIVTVNYMIRLQFVSFLLSSNISETCPAKISICQCKNKCLMITGTPVFCSILVKKKKKKKVRKKKLYKQLGKYVSTGHMMFFFFRFNLLTETSLIRVISAREILEKKSFHWSAAFWCLLSYFRYRCFSGFSSSVLCH